MNEIIRTSFYLIALGLIYTNLTTQQSHFSSYMKVFKEHP